jgi:hypothetical protein
VSDDRIRSGQVWVERGKEEYRPGETAKKPRLWLVLRGPHKRGPAPASRVQVELMNLESAGVRRVNLESFRRKGKKRAWELWLDPPTEPDQTEPKQSDLK